MHALRFYYVFPLFFMLMLYDIYIFYLLACCKQTIPFQKKLLIFSNVCEASTALTQHVIRLIDMVLKGDRAVKLHGHAEVTAKLYTEQVRLASFFCKLIRIQMNIALGDMCAVFFSIRREICSSRTL